MRKTPRSSPQSNAELLSEIKTLTGSTIAEYLMDIQQARLLNVLFTVTEPDKRKVTKAARWGKAPDPSEFEE